LLVSVYIWLWVVKQLVTNFCYDVYEQSGVSHFWNVKNSVEELDKFVPLIVCLIPLTIMTFLACTYTTLRRLVFIFDSVVIL
jgi:hypothetical protein